MTLDTKKAKEILETLGVKFLPTNGKAVDQAMKAIEEKGYVLNEENELVDKEGNKTTINVPKNIDKDATKVLMKENVLHDGVQYEKGKEYKLGKEIEKIFLEKKFI